MTHSKFSTMEERCTNIGSVARVLGDNPTWQAGGMRGWEVNSLVLDNRCIQRTMQQHASAMEMKAATKKPPTEIFKAIVSFMVRGYGQNFAMEQDYIHEKWWGERILKEAIKPLWSILSFNFILSKIISNLLLVRTLPDFIMNSGRMGYIYNTITWLLEENEIIVLLFIQQKNNWVRM